MIKLYYLNSLNTLKSPALAFIGEEVNDEEELNLFFRLECGTYERTLNDQPIINNAVEGFHCALRAFITSMHPN